MTEDSRLTLSMNPAQREAVLHGAGPCAVIAGPGSGKTHVLVHRICHLLESGLASPSQILVLTFSRAAAAQMRARFLDQSRRSGSAGAGAGVVFGTFHSIFFQILRESGSRKLRVLDTRTKQRYLEHLSRTMDATPEELQLLISRCKNGLVCRQKWLPALVKEYDSYLRSRGCLDFDDMLLQCRDLLSGDPELLSSWRQRFSWILVDEFQDVSAIQYEVLRLLAAPLDNLFIVGDDDQSIYGFRGADPETMQRFLADYQPSVHRIRLMTNYRCGKKILEAASAVIRDNRNRIEKQLIHGNGEEGYFDLRTFTDREDQYAHLARELGAMPGKELERSAVIFRTHAGAAAFIPVLRAHKIPFQAEQSLRRTRSAGPESRILMDLISYYRAAEDLAGRGALRSDLLQILNRPERFLSGSFLQSERVTESALLGQGSSPGPLGHAARVSESALPGQNRNSGEEIRELCRDLSLLRSLPTAYSLRYLLDSVGYRTWAAENFRETGSLFDALRMEAANCSSPSSWLDYLMQRLRSLQEGEGSDPSVQGSGSNAGVRVMTMHACKGLEFDTVFVPDLNEGNIPPRQSFTGEQIEEERRLLYVAMTRARKSLVLTCLEGTPDRPAAPSRFILHWLRGPSLPHK